MHHLAYAKSVSPHLRVGRFVADETRLAWAFELFRRIPRAEAYVVGGSARDAVRGILPKDLHIVVRNLPADILAQELRKLGAVEEKATGRLFFKPQNTGPDFIEVSLPFDKQPEAYAPITYDLGQRDFTMNALAYSLNSGLVIDPFGGLKDIHSHTLRAVGRPGKRFEEDPRRTLRAIRLASEHGYAIADTTWQSLKRHLPHLQKIHTNNDGRAEYVTPRRHIGREFLRTLGGQPVYGLKLWRDSGASDLFTPELKKLDSIQHRRGDTAQSRAEQTLGDLGHPVPTLVFASLLAHLEDISLEAAEAIIVRLHLHNAHPHFHYKDALWMLKHRNVLSEADPEAMPASVFENVFGKQRGQHLLSFLHATNRASKQHTLTRERLHKATRRRHVLLTDIQKPPLLRGRDLESMGVQPGPQYRNILAKIRDAQLDGHVSDKDEALNYARNLVAAHIY